MQHSGCFPDHVGMSWMGGANADGAPISPARGPQRDPGADADKVGRDGAERLAKRLTRIRLIDTAACRTAMTPRTWTGG